MNAGVGKASADVQPEDSLKLEACLMMLFGGIFRSKVPYFGCGLRIWSRWSRTHGPTQIFEKVFTNVLCVPRY